MGPSCGICFSLRHPRPNDFCRDFVTLAMKKKRKKQVYSGFPLVPETEIDGWCYGAITEFINPEYHPNGTTDGDGFVQAPDGSRAGLVWDVGSKRISTIDADSDDWGLYHVWFPKPIQTINNLREGFAHVPPALQRMYEKRKTSKTKPRKVNRKT